MVIQIRRRLFFHVVSVVTALIMVLSVFGMNVFAVTGSQVAADGTYSGYSSEGTVTVTVSNGKIAGVSANVKSKYQGYISSAFSSVIGKAATANNIDAVSSSTKHMGAIVSGAKSAIQSAPAADGSESGDDSGSGSGSGAGQTTSQNEFTVEVGGTQELSVISDDNYTYTWKSADTSKVTVSGTGATATVKGLASTESPVKVTCTYGFMGISNTKEYLFNVVSAENEEIQSGVGEKTGTKHTGKAYVNDDETDEWVELDVYVSDGKITGIFIASEEGSWLNLLTVVKENFLGLNADSDDVDAVSSATTKGFRDTIRKAVSAALKDVEEETPAAPQLTGGDGTSYTKESSSGLTFTSDADYSTFQSVKIDGTEIASKNYSVKNGSTVVTLSPDYLDTLGNGSHSIGIVSAAGTASGTFTVAAASGSGSGSSGGSSTSSGSYTGTAVSSLTDGDYIIAGRYRSYTDYYALGNSTAGDSGSGYAYAGIDVTIDGSTATVTDPAAVWTWDSTAGSFYNAASGKYLALPSNKNSAGNFFSTSPVALTFYSISGNEATVYSPYGSGGYYLGAAYPGNGKAFGSQYGRYMNSNYISSGSGVYFYKIESSQEQKAEITLDKTSATLELGESDTVTATLTGCSDLTYTASNSDIAEVSINGSSITVKGKAAGTTVLTFSAAAAGSYTAPDTVTLTVTVNKGSGGSGTGGGTTTTTPGNPTYVKSISPENEVADDYTISLNVTADDLQSTTTTGGTAGKNGTNLVMVIDVSGSIVGKESDLNSAIRSLVNGLPENSQVGVVAFNESATTGQIFTKESISGLRFSGVEDAGTNMATGINAAASLLNGSGWTKSDNDKAMVIISDFDIDDYTDAINAAKTVKGGGAKVYSVNFGVNSIQEANKTELTSDDKVTANYNVTRYISSQYPSASAVNNSMFGMFNQASVTPGNPDTSAAYVYGASGGNWSDIFAEIKASEGITEESTLPMTNVVITDTLSDYVDLANTDSTAKYGVTLESTDTAVSIKGVTLSEDGKTVTVSLDGNLTDETAYTVKIPVKPSEKAVAESNQSSVAMQSYYSNTTAGMSYEYDADHTGTVTYKEKPTILVARQVTLTYNDNVTDEEITVPEAASAAVVTEESADNYNKAEFTIGNDPTREGYTFLGWNTDKGAAEGDSAYTAGSKVNLGANTTLYAIWKPDYRVIFEDYTEGGVTISGLDVADYEGHENCKIGTSYYNGEVSFTLSADMAVVAAVHTDGSEEKLLDQNGSYERLYCTEDHTFKVDVSKGDVYIVLAYKGDLDLNKRTNTRDSQIAAQVAARLETLNSLKSLVGDVHIDNRNNTRDSQICAQVAAKNEVHSWDLTE